jgi:hypothetical protein
MKKEIIFCLLLTITVFIDSQENNIYEFIINRDVNIFIEEYKTIDLNILALELIYENNNVINHNDFFVKIISQVKNSIELLPIINKIYWSGIKCMAISMVLYNSGNLQEDSFLSGMPKIKNGLILILQGAEIMGLNVNSVVLYIPKEYSNNNIRK